MATVVTEGTCKLCLKTTKLCKSHIVPEFCYGPMYNEKHQIFLGRFKNSRLVKRPIQKGYWEYLLCEKCEGIINEYETAFHDYWYGPTGIPPRVIDDQLVLRNADYRTFKLFHLSVLWRVGVSSSFSGINLGPYADRVRKILLEGRAVPQEHYPIVGCVLLDDEQRVLHILVSAPLVNRRSGSTCYTLCYAGCEWVFIVTDHPTRKQMDLAQTITKGGTITLLAEHFSKGPTSTAIIRRLRQIRREQS